MTGTDNRQESRTRVSLLASELHESMQELPIGAHLDMPPSADICYSLELFIPEVLRQRYPEWETESLDGIFIARATKTSPATVELIGTCILISDQTITPFFVDLELSPKADGDAVVAARVLLGEPGSGSLGISGPPCNSPEAQQLLMSLVDRIDKVAWVYTFRSGKLM